ncbi:glycosyltransferase [Telmatospirillum sp.]|uniref:glycosyltransferase n=1 Tax=Telmatospirillum sp. TaxID=2079197 RepID=UPI002852853F|nr:glycosyltransferase [Telmatospirillum sp.]
MEVNTHQLSVALQKTGFSVGVLSGLGGHGLVGFQARLRIKLLRNPSPVDYLLGYPTWRSWFSSSVVERVAAIFQPDVVVVQGGDEIVPLLKNFLKLGLPVIGYLHNSGRLPLDEELRNHPRLHFVVNSNFTASLHPEKPVRAVIRPIVPPDMYAVESNRTAAVFVNPAPYKGVDIVMNLAKARPDVNFLFVVNGMPTPPPPAELRPANVKVVGPFKNMKSVYKEAKVVLAPSQWEETWGRIATEAQISGIPVLASSRGGLPEAVGPGGLCLPPDASPDEWQHAFSTIWDTEAGYQQFVTAAYNFSRRPEIQPESIVKSFGEVLEFAVTSR